MGDFCYFKTAAIVSTGTEILQGMYPDTNAQWMAQQLLALGVHVTAITASPDDADGIEQAVRFAATRADLVITSGGLGPTLDDVTRTVLAGVGGTELYFEPKVMQMMTDRFAAHGRVLPSGNDVQAWVPVGATIFYNDWGTAPGWFLPPASERDASGEGVAAAALLALPGPPAELKPMFTQLVLPLLRTRVEGGAHHVHTRTLHLYGYSESTVGQMVAPFFHLREDVVFTILARPMGLELRLTVTADTEAEMLATLDEVTAQVLAVLPTDAVYGRDGETMAAVVGRLLKERGQTVTTAESCTGGLIAKMLTDEPGSSAYFNEGHVCYANDVKERVLGVNPETLMNYGAVSQHTAAEMAVGARRVAGADYALAVTGIAGPDGGTREKPVGLIYIGLAMEGGATEVVKHSYVFNREANRNHTALTALNLLRKQMLGLS